jgi:hypothetical protein
MRQLAIYTLFTRQGRPLITSVHDSQTASITTLKLFAKETGLTIYDVEQNVSIIRRIIMAAASNNTPILIADFKRHIEAFDLPYAQAIHYPAYEQPIPCELENRELTELIKLSEFGVQQVAAGECGTWQWLMAESAPVYCDLQQRGININFKHEFPEWSSQTYSGRSKTLGVNAQGLDETYVVTNPLGCENDVLLHFDWVSADINVAAYLANDQALQETFIEGDPYTHIEQLMDGQIERSACKRILLAAINSLDTSNPVLLDIFPALGVWINATSQKIDRLGYAEGMFGRRYSTSSSRSKLAAFNGAIQGSTALAMKATIRRIWENFGAAFLMEIHDSLICTSRRDPTTINRLVDGILSIMTTPFALVPNIDPRLRDLFFPVKVSIGQAYKQWKQLKIARKADYVKPESSPQSSP